MTMRKCDLDVELMDRVGLKTEVMRLREECERLNAEIVELKAKEVTIKHVGKLQPMPYDLGEI